MRTGARVWSVLVGAGAGLLGTAVWLGTVALAPPVPGNALGATALVLVSMAAAGWLARHRARWTAVLAAGAVGSWSVVAAVVILLRVVSDRWVPSIVTQAMTPADNVRESRIETVDPYVGLGFLGLVLTLGLVVALQPGLARRIGHWLVPPVGSAPAPQAR
jgi:hypothetical protein